MPGTIGGPVFEECARDFGGGMAPQRLDCGRLNVVGLAWGKAGGQRVQKLGKVSEAEEFNRGAAFF